MTIGEYIVNGLLGCFFAGITYLFVIYPFVYAYRHNKKYDEAVEQEREIQIRNRLTSIGDE